MVFFLLRQLPPLREEVQFVLLFTFFCHVYHSEWSPICICVCGTLCSCCRSRCVCLNRPCDHIRVKRSENKVPGPASWDLHAVLGSLIQNRQKIRQSPHSLWATSDQIWCFALKTSPQNGYNNYTDVYSCCSQCYNNQRSLTKTTKLWRSCNAPRSRVFNSSNSVFHGYRTQE